MPRSRTHRAAPYDVRHHSPTLTGPPKPTVLAEYPCATKVFGHGWPRKGPSCPQFIHYCGQTRGLDVGVVLEEIKSARSLLSPRSGAPQGDRICEDCQPYWCERKAMRPRLGFSYFPWSTSIQRKASVSLILPRYIWVVLRSWCRSSTFEITSSGTPFRLA